MCETVDYGLADGPTVRKRQDCGLGDRSWKDTTQASQSSTRGGQLACLSWWRSLTGEVGRAKPVPAAI